MFLVLVSASGVFVRHLPLIIPLAALACAPAPALNLVDDFVSAELEILPPPTDLTLDVSELRPGDTVTFTADGASPNSQVRFLLGLSAGAGPCPGLLGGLCLDLLAPKSLVTSAADSSGIATGTFTIPSAAPIDATVYFQAVVTGSNAQVSELVTSTVLGPLVPDFLITDENTDSMTAGEEVSPRDHVGRVSAWYFGHAT
jgi:hypothetical protein